MALSIRTLSDRSLIEHFAEIVKRDRGINVQVIVCMAEIDLRRLYAPAGYG